MPHVRAVFNPKPTSRAVCYRREQVRKLQSQGRRGGDGAGATGGRADGGSPAVKEAKKAELAAWLATEIEVGALRDVNHCIGRGRHAVFLRLTSAFC